LPRRSAVPCGDCRSPSATRRTLWLAPALCCPAAAVGPPVGRRHALAAPHRGRVRRRRRRRRLALDRHRGEAPTLLTLRYRADVAGVAAGMVVTALSLLLSKLAFTTVVVASDALRSPRHRVVVCECRPRKASSASRHSRGTAFHLGHLIRVSAAPDVAAAAVVAVVCLSITSSHGMRCGIRGTGPCPTYPWRDRLSPATHCGTSYQRVADGSCPQVCSLLPCFTLLPGVVRRCDGVADLQLRNCVAVLCGVSQRRRGPLLQQRRLPQW
jgi:hypothetical protein